MMERTHVLVVAAGRGSRAGTGLPKQYRVLAGRSVLARTLDTFLSRPDIRSIVTVIHPDDRNLYETAVAGLDGLSEPVRAATRGRTACGPASRPWRRAVPAATTSC